MQNEEERKENPQTSRRPPSIVRFGVILRGPGRSIGPQAVLRGHELPGAPESDRARSYAGIRGRTHDPEGVSARSGWAGVPPTEVACCCRPRPTDSERCSAGR